MPGSDPCQSGPIERRIHALRGNEKTNAVPVRSGPGTAASRVHARVEPAWGNRLAIKELLKCPGSGAGSYGMSVKDSDTRRAIIGQRACCTGEFKATGDGPGTGPTDA